MAANIFSTLNTHLSGVFTFISPQAASTSNFIQCISVFIFPTFKFAFDERK